MSSGLFGGIAGAALGSQFGPMGAQIGFAVGSWIFGSMDQEDTHGPRLQDRTVQISALGANIPIVWGNWRLAGNVFWPANFAVDEVTHSESAKGGAPENITYTYTATFAVLLCRRPRDRDSAIAGIGRIWMNKKLVYDPNQTPSTDPCITTMRVYTGTETQTPDPLMVALDGSAPAYLGYAYIIFEDLELTQSGFGNRPPSVEVEVFTNAESSGPPHPRFSYDGLSAPVGTGTIAQIAVVDPTTGLVWSTTYEDAFGSQVFTSVNSDTSQTQTNTFTTALANCVILDICYVPTEAGVSTNEIWVGGWVFIASDVAVIYDADTPAFKETADLGFRGTARFQCFAYNPTTLKVVTFGLNGNVFIIDPITRTAESSFNTSAGATSCSKIIVTTDYLAFCLFGGTECVQFRSRLDYSLVAQVNNPYPGSTNSFSYDPVREKLIITAIQGTTLAVNLIDLSTFTLTSHTPSMTDGYDGVLPEPSRDFVSGAYVAYNDRYIFSSDGLGAGSPSPGTTLYIVNPDTMTTEVIWTYESGTGLLIPNLYTPKDDPAWVLGFDGTNLKRMNLGTVTTGSPVPLSEIVNSISTDDPLGLEEADINVTSLTPLVDGYAVGQQMTRRAAIEALMPGYFFDAVESDHTLKFVLRGTAPIATVAKDDRAAHPEGDEMPANLQSTRLGELELPWALDVRHVDEARDYQIGVQYDRRITRNSNNPVIFDLPINMTSEKAKQCALVNLYLLWLRKRFVFHTTLAYSKYEPTDIVLLENGDITYQARLVSRSDKGNGIIEWEADLEDAFIYSQSGFVPASNFVPQVIADPGETVLYMIDSAMLRDADTDPGPYVAAYGTTDGWPGATLYKSFDGGSSYVPITSLPVEATVGIAQSALGSFSAGNIFDEGNAVTVVLQAGGPLTSATADQVLNGSNTAVFGAAGRWEVINFKNATLVAADTYQLSGLLRGRRGTEWAIGTHASGDTFILASTTAWRRILQGTSEIGVARLYKAPPFRVRTSAVDSESFTLAAVALEPYSPVNLKATRNAGDITFTWSRRARYGYGTLNAIVPLGETTESYSIDVMNGSTVVRTLTSSTQTVAYTAAQQTTDFGSPQSSVTVRVYQLSDVVGRGYALEAAA